MSKNNNNATLTEQAKSAADIAAGHGQYLQGAAESAIGSATGSQAWSETGENIKQQAAESIRAAVNNAPDGGKVGELANEACPSTGQGLGSKGN
ncbi:unnamed protein product [Sympodiomycopsis kandeliae]